MSGAAQFNFSLVFTSDTARAKAGLADVTGGLTQVKAAAAEAGAATAKEAAELERLAAAAVKATSSQDQLVAAEKRAQASRAQNLIAPLAMPVANVGPLQAAYKATETAAGALQSSVAGLTVSFGAQAQEAVEVAAANRAYQASLDDVRASFNPLFAAARQYEQQLERIATAEKIGAISAQEAATARMAAVERRDRGEFNQMNPYTANIGAQGFDIGVTAMMGMDPMMIGFQQGSQLAGIAQQMGGGAKAAKEMAAGLLSIFNLTSLVTIGLVTLGAAGIQWLMSLSDETKTFDENLKDLDKTLARMRTNFDLIGNRGLSEIFGNLTGDVRGLAQGLLELDRAAELKNLEGVVSQFLSDRTEATLGQRLSLGAKAWSPSAVFGATGSEINNALLEPMRAENYAAMGAANSYADFESRIGAIGDLAKAGDIEGVTADLLALQGAMSGNAGYSAMSAELRELLAGLATAGIKTAEIEALWNGSAEAERTKSWLADQQDRLEAITRETALIGATNEERLRANALAEAEIEIRKRKLSGADAEDHRQRASARATAQALKDQQAAMYGIGVGVLMDGFDARAASERNPRLRADIEGEKEYTRQVAEGASELVAWAAAARVKAKALTDLKQEQDDFLTSQAESLDQLQLELTLIGASNEARTRALALAKAEAEILKLGAEGDRAEEIRKAALAIAEAETLLARKSALHDIGISGQMDGFDARIRSERNPWTRAAIEAEKEYARVLAQSGDAQQAAAASALTYDRAITELGQSQEDYQRGQRERIADMQLELALIGQTEDVRRRVLALAQAERDILNIGVTGSRAEEIRRDALAQAELTREIEAQADAWGRVQSAGEDAIDAVLDKLRAGDIRGAFAELIGEIEQMYFDLAIRNPLKNAMMGTNLGTWADTGGWGGIWDRLTGKATVNESALVSQAVQAMTVNAANVTIGGAGMSAFLSTSGGGAGMAPMGAFSGLGGSGDVQSQVWAFFAAKGLKPHQIAAIMGNIGAESGFNPLAVGDGGTSFGLFQHHAGRGQSLLDFVGGQAGLANVQAQLEFMWQEMLTGENGVLKRLQGSNNLYDATKAFVGFERPQGWSAGNPQGAMHWDKRLAGAEAAMAAFEGQVYATGQGVGLLGTGAAAMGQNLQGFGSQLGGLLQGIGAQHGPLGSFAGGLLSHWLSGIGFMSGGDTGPGADTDVAGVVHANEYVFDARATRRIGVANLEAIRRGSMRGYLQGGHVVGGLPPMSPISLGGDASPAAAQTDRRVVFEINVSGTGPAEIKQGVDMAIAQAFDVYGREVLPSEVKRISSDKWGS